MSSLSCDGFGQGIQHTLPDTTSSAITQTSSYRHHRSVIVYVFLTEVCRLMWTLLPNITIQESDPMSDQTKFLLQESDIPKA